MQSRISFMQYVATKDNDIIDDVINNVDATLYQIILHFSSDKVLLSCFFSQLSGRATVDLLSIETSRSSSQSISEQYK